MLQVDNLRVTYGGAVAVDDVGFSIGSDEICGLIGPNGAGKTSVIDAVTGYTRAAGGTIRFRRRDITTDAPHRRARRGLTRTFQSVELFDELTVEENLVVAATTVTISSTLRELFRRPAAGRRADIDLALSLCGLADVADRYPPELSHGRRKLVGVARALAPRPRLVLLDEPAAGLDSEESLALGRRLRELPEHGIAVLLVDHDMGLVLGTCDRVLVLDSGRLIRDGTPQQIRDDPAVIESYLGSE